MKTLVVIAFFAGFSSSVFAQKYVPVIKEGSVINYDAYSKGLGQHVPLILTIKSLGDPVKIQWDVDGYGTGSFEIPAMALDSGSKLVIKQPDPDGVTKMKNDETLMIISKATFGSLVKNNAFQLNGQKFTVSTDTTAYKINDKTADIFHAVSENGKGELWVLNNPDFPLIYKAKSVTRGVDFTLTGIKE
jgi:hypothetical protein